MFVVNGVPVDPSPHRRRRQQHPPGHVVHQAGMSKMASSSRKAQLGVQGSAAVAMMCCWWPEEEPDDGRCSSAACPAAHRMSSGTAVRALGSVWTESGKLRSAALAPRSAMAATSCARAAISGVG
ncbi:hypothetical protein GQ55_5G004600 [Panicum hallii var. hallii]|uniref:Uncharacterized protein n=1 Tax=Panicum hallii var. hallii TaxID=1504633 RepID=A0A2T7DB78_9POAL|nr:hypothetical protein GQ55_5G004600 [Panicum hallii var. hallii]